tara:strand:+ start:824 stop:1030 length:207 start_codon:yes stop_codon:yes gene_type:complete
MKKLSSTDYVVLRYGKRREGLDVIYSAETIIDMLNDGVESLSDDEQFVRMTDLPLVMQKDYLNKINEH